jgi:hypothetical protein
MENHFRDRNKAARLVWRIAVQHLPQNEITNLRFQFLTSAIIKIDVLWDVTPSSLVEIYKRFGGVYCLRHQSVDLIKN